MMTTYTQSRYRRVLIESDWNLKAYNIQRRRSRNVVLIESDWNLKDNFRTGFLFGEEY